jgi:hypothetical protein
MIALGAIAFASAVPSRAGATAAESSADLSGADTDSPANVGLSVSGKDQTPDTPRNVASFDFGSVNPLDESNVETRVRLTNSSAKPLVLTRIQPSCHCTTAIIQTTNSPGSASLPFTLAPGQDATLDTSIDILHGPSGPERKLVDIYVQGSDRPAAEVEVSGIVLPMLSIDPHVLDFGRVESKQGSSRTLRISADSRLAVAGRLPPLVSGTPMVTVTPKPALVPTTVAGNHTASPGTVTAEYTVSIPQNSALGPLLGSLTFAPAASQTLGATDASSIALSTTSIPVTGQVIGDVSAQPDILQFGMVPFGRATTQMVTLTSSTSSQLDNARAASNSAYVSVRLITSASPLSATERLEVTITPQAPQGLLQSQIKVVFGNGERLLLPVSAFVQS